MNQRLSIPFTKHITATESIRTLTLQATQYLLLSGAVETPFSFLDQDEIRDALENPPKGDGFQLSPKESSPEEGPEEIVSSLTLNVLKEPAGCILHFDNDNCLAIVGYQSDFFMVDLRNGLFCATKSPEYDVLSYVEQYGSPGFKGCSLLLGKVEPEALVSPVKVNQKKKPATKKAKLAENVT